MSSPTGAHGEADATKQENEQQPQSTASTDATLNARAKSSNGAKSQGPKKWLIALIAVIAAVAVIVAIAVTRGKNDDANTSGVTKADTVTIGLKLAPVSLDTDYFALLPGMNTLTLSGAAGSCEHEPEWMI